jgi:hypothetical protein
MTTHLWPPIAIFCVSRVADTCARTAALADMNSGSTASEIGRQARI